MPKSKDVLSKKIKNVLVSEDVPVKSALDTLQKNAIKIAFVVNAEQKLLGCVTDGDIRRGLLRGISLDEKVSGVMNAEPVTAPYGIPEQELLRLMNDKAIQQVPLVSGDGIIRDIALLPDIARKYRMIPLSEPHLGERELAYVSECVRTNTISAVGRFIGLFEREFSRYLGVKYAVATCNGTAAIHTALVVLGIGKGDEVIVPALTFVASVNPVLYVGATPVFVDSESETWSMDPAKIEEKITPRTKAIIPVHLYGRASNMRAITEVAQKHNLKIIEDATESLGSKCYGKPVGTLGDIGCFSFNGNKLITTGGGGMIVTENEAYAKRARYLINQARNDAVEYIHNEVGFNYRLSNVQAAIGLAQIEKLQDYIETKRKNVTEYNRLLARVPGVIIPREPDWGFNCFWMYSILLDKEKYGMSKGELIKELNERGIQARPFFKPLHMLPPYTPFSCGNISVAVRLYDMGMNLPCSVGITPPDIEKVCSTIAELQKGKSA